MKDALTFLMTREIAHQKSFEKALYSIENNFPPGKNPGDPRFTSVYFNLSQGEAVPAPGPWNNPANFEVRSTMEESLAVDGGTGLPSVGLTDEEVELVSAAAIRTASDPASDPQTGAELGATPLAAEELTKSPKAKN